jgi:hypothetical protein
MAKKNLVTMVFAPGKAPAPVEERSYLPKSGQSKPIHLIWRLQKRLQFLETKHKWSHKNSIKDSSRCEVLYDI